MRITALVPHTAMIDGVHRAAFDVCRSLTARGHEARLLYSRSGDSLAAWRGFAASAEQVKVEISPRAPVSGLARVVAARRAAAAQPDIVYCHRIDQLNFAAALSYFARVPLVFHAHNSPPAWFHRRKPSVAGVRRIAAVVVAADFTAAQWEQAGFAKRSIHRVPYGIDLQHFRPPSAQERAAARRALGLPARATIIGFVGRLERIKGVHILADAFRRVAADVPAAWLVLQGGPGREVDPAESERYIGRLHAATEARRTVWLPPSPDVRPLMRAADVLAVPSLWQEPSGIVVAEAMAHGVPVVASKTGGMWEQIPPMLECALVPAGDVDALARALLSLHDWREKCSVLGAELREHVRRHKDLQTMTSRIEALFLSLVKKV